MIDWICFCLPGSPTWRAGATWSRRTDSRSMDLFALSAGRQVGSSGGPDPLRQAQDRRSRLGPDIRPDAADGAALGADRLHPRGVRRLDAGRVDSGRKALCRGASPGNSGAASGRLRGVLWHQGESEANDETRARTYLERFTRVVEAFRRDLEAPALPVVVGQLGGFLRRSGVDFATPLADVVNRQLAQAPAAIPHSAFVPSGGLAHRGDELHFNATSLREFGRRYAHAFLMLDPTWT